MKYIEHIVYEHLCEDCETPLGDHEGNPCVEHEDNYYCYDCALKRRIIDADDWLRAHGIGIYDHAIYKNGYIIAYQKWGRGYRKDTVRIFEDENI
jgi:hypothetical protein